MESHEETAGHDENVASSMGDSAFVVVDEGQGRTAESTGGSFFLVSPSSSIYGQQVPPSLASSRLSSGGDYEDDGVLVSQHQDQRAVASPLSPSSPTAAVTDSISSFHGHQRLEPSLLVEDNLFNHQTPPPSPKIRVRSRPDGTVHLISPTQAHYMFPELMKVSASFESSLLSSSVSTTPASSDGIELTVDASSFVLEGIIEFAQHMQSGEKALDLEIDKPFILERFPTRVQLEQLLVFLRQTGFQHMIEGVEAILAEIRPVSPPASLPTTQPLPPLEETKASDLEKSLPPPPTENELPVFLRWAVPAATATVLGVGALVLLKAMR